MNKYPRIEEFGLKISEDQPGPPGIGADEFQKLEKKMGLPWMKQFDRHFGCQTCSANGAYPWDVESVLERMVSGKLTGTQLHWD